MDSKIELMKILTFIRFAKTMGLATLKKWNIAIISQAPTPGFYRLNWQPVLPGVMWKFIFLRFPFQNTL
jgi:hypothetical protein